MAWKVRVNTSVFYFANELTLQGSFVILSDVWRTDNNTREPIYNVEVGIPKEGVDGWVKYKGRWGISEHSKDRYEDPFLFRE